MTLMESQPTLSCITVDLAKLMAGARLQTKTKDNKYCFKSKLGNGGEIDQSM